ncbi:LCP family protein [Candidatus Falkowbacteria bacterium]|nr:LCP family protein [Candidatus Falkowbacteria bacterium]
MNGIEPNFLSEEDKLTEKPRKKIKIISKISIYLLIIFVIIIIIFGIDIISSGDNLAKTLGNTNLWGQIKHLIGSEDKKALGEEEDRINILLLGMGGIEHEGPFLTDTIMLVSFKPSNNQVALISIPRDMAANIPGYGWFKVNHANSYGEFRNPGRGGELAKEVVGQTLGIPVHYYVRIDFAGFKQIIDDLGGITVEVENILDDPFYPVPGKETATTSERYEHLYIEPGKQHMDGELALKYVRSRQGRGIEGSDFARSKRQQKVLSAVKEKGFSFGTLANPYKISKVMDTLSQHLATDLKVWEIIRIFNLGKDVAEENITRRVFDDSPNGQLAPLITEEGAFLLVPTAGLGNFSEIQLIVQNIFNPEKIEEIKPKFIEIHNGTKINGLALQISQYLESLGYNVNRIKNAPTQDYQKTVVYNLNQGFADETAEQIAELLEAELAPSAPGWATATSGNEVSGQADVLIILGQNRKNF